MAEAQRETLTVSVRKASGMYAAHIPGESIRATCTHSDKLPAESCGRKWLKKHGRAGWYVMHVTLGPYQATLGPFKDVAKGYIIVKHDGDEVAS